MFIVIIAGFLSNKLAANRLRDLALQRTLSIWRDAAREFFEVDMEGGEALEPGFDVTASRLIYANLVVVDFVGGGSQTLLATTR